MKKLLVLIVALMASFTLSAQEMRYGVTGGVNFAWMHNPVSSSDAYVGFNAGIKAEKFISLQSTGRLTYAAKRVTISTSKPTILPFLINTIGGIDEYEATRIGLPLFGNAISGISALLVLCIQRLRISS